MSGLPPDFEGTVKMRLWLQKLNQMSASSELGEEEARQLLFDLESSYGAFSRHLQSARS
jgi:ESCRT-I complex subunit VPS28